MKSRTRINIIVLFFSLYACTSIQKENTLNQCNIVASKVFIGKDTLVVCDVSKIKQQIKLPLSTLVKDWKLLKLENSSKEALVQPIFIYPSKNYILIHPVEFNRGAMLFDNAGKYLFDIGKKGNGPGEIVANMSSIEMDEDNDCVYIRDHKPSRILKYRLSTGKYLSDIPLSYPKAFEFLLNPKKETLIVSNPPHMKIEEDIPWIWEQDFQGNILQELPKKIYNRNLQYRFWLWNRNDEIVFFDYNLPGRQDTLCHYDMQSNRLKPRFTTDFGSEIPAHQYEDTSDFYLITSLGNIERANPKPLHPTKRILIDKKTLKGAYIDIVLDGYGDFSINHHWTYFKDSYFTLGLEPHQVAETCEKLLAHPENLKPEEKKNLQELLDGITEDDNAFILYGKI